MDVYVDFMVLSGEGVPRQAMHVQGDTLQDVLKDKKKHCRQLQLQTEYLRKVLDKQVMANAEEINKAGIGTQSHPLWIHAAQLMVYLQVVGYTHCACARSHSAVNHAMLSCFGCKCGYITFNVS